jgi:ubiquinone/menaquinone biosynthesis C-methylase UbiE
LEKSFDYIVGLDITLQNLRIAKESINAKSKVDFILADINYLPFYELSFDIVLCSEVLEHLYEPAKALRELSRVFRKTLLLTAPITNVCRHATRVIQYNYRLCKIEADIGHVSMHDWMWWKSIVREIVKNRGTRYDIKTVHPYISSEPFTSIFAACRKNTILKVIDKALDIMEKILSRPMFANCLVMTATAQ